MKKAAWSCLLLVMMVGMSATRASSICHPKFVSLLIILDEPAYFDELAAWLYDVRFHNLTFAVCDAQNPDNYWLSNMTRLNTLKEYGILIPQTSWMQQYEPTKRKTIIDDVVSKWINLVGYSPKGTFDFQPDTYTVDYCETKNMTYVTGYCFDQYAVDWMTERGGWQIPYYASHDNVLIPNNVTSHGTVIYPHQVWDWVSSFTVSHSLNTHPLSLVNSVFGGNTSKAEDYFLNLVDRSIEAEPFGFVSVQFEWVWHYRSDAYNYVRNWIKNLLASRDYHFWTYEDVTQWFNNQYSTTPDYHLLFRSPYDDQEIEWYYCKDFRIARTGDQVISYIEYGKQQPDKFFFSTFTPNISLSSHEPDNSIDNSLSFGIDGLGGGEFRAPVRDSGVTYKGELSQFALQNIPEMISPVLPIIVLTITIMSLSYVFKRKRAKQ